MTDANANSVLVRTGKTLLGSIVALLTVPTGLGPALGGWLAGHRASTPVRGGLAGGAAGILGALPWAGLVYLASAGAIEPVGYHEGGVHVGINTVAPGTLPLWLEVGLAVLVAGVIVAAAVAGGIAAGLSTDIVGDVREAFSNAN
jgi:hypothetical protein